MAFKKVATLDTDDCVTIGGTDKKTGKANPKSIEGYLLGTRTLGPNKFNKTKTDYMHILQTKNGNVGVWGKTHMDRQVAGVSPGTMIKISFAGTRDVGKGNDMTCFLVEVDADETIDVSALQEASITEDSESFTYTNGEQEEESEEEETSSDEAPVARSKPPVRAAPVASAAQQSKVKALLGGKAKQT